MKRSYMSDAFDRSLAEARRFVLATKYDEALAIYETLLSADLSDRALFAEQMAVKGQLIDIQVGQYVEKALRHLTEMNLLASKRDLRTLLQAPRYGDPGRLERCGFKVYSQNDEDGIITEIFRRIGAEDQRFFEFGVQIGVESNTHFLLHQGWKGVWAEANPDYVAEIRSRFASQIARGQLTILHEFITTENINHLIGATEFDLLSIDIDFNDYWIFKALDARPRVVVIEFNGKFPPPVKHVVTYDPTYTWSGSDYFGCSLQSLTDMANAKGYTLVGVNMLGVNAFFVRNDLCNDLFASPATAEHLYNPPHYELQRTAAFAVGHPLDRNVFGNWLNI